jgi:hypothetical protein
MFVVDRSAAAVLLPLALLAAVALWSNFTGSRTPAAAEAARIERAAPDRLARVVPVREKEG